MFDPRRSFPRFARALASGLVLSASLAIPTASAQATKTARDAYVEAWFKETAEADLAGALALYKQCLDSAATSDRELAARALLRIAKIAQARGEKEVAASQLDRLAKEFDGTAAAKEAQAEAAAPAETPTGESREVIEARRWLDEMLTNERDDSPRKAKTIFSVLGLEEILRVYAARGGNLAQFLGALDASLLTPEQWIDVALTEGTYNDVLLVVLAKLRTQKPEQIPEAFTHKVAKNPTQDSVIHFLEVSLALGTSDAVGAANEVLRAAVSGLADFRYADSYVYFQIVLTRLIETDIPDVSVLVASWLGGLKGVSESTQSLAFSRMGGSDDGIRRLLASVCSQTNGARVFWSEILRVNVRLRAQVIRQIVEQDPKSIPEAIVARWLEDPEPAIRTLAIAYQLKQDNNEQRRAAARVLARETSPIEVRPIESVLRSSSTVPVEAIEETSGALREYLYHQSYRSKAGLAALRLGLERGDVEAIHALFDPRFAESRTLVSFGSSSIDATYLLRNGSLRDAFAKDSDPDLLRKAVTAALAIPDPRLHLAVLGSVEGFLDGGRLGAGIADSFAALGSARIDVELARRTQVYNALSVESRKRLLRSTDRETRVSAIWKCTEANLLREIARDGDPSDFPPLFERAKQLPDFPLALEILKRVPPHDPLATLVFLFALPREPEALIVACERGAESALGEAAEWAVQSLIFANRVDQDSLRGKIEESLDGLVLPATLQTALREAHGRSGAEPIGQRFATVLRANLAAWRECLIAKEASRLFEQSQGDIGVGDQIAALGATEFARGLLEHSESIVRQIGLRALAVLGEKDAVIAYARAHANPEEWVRHLLRVGAHEEILDAIRTGRVTRAEVASRVDFDTDPTLLRDVLLGEAPVDALFSTRTDGHAILKRLIDARVVAKDVDALVRAVDFYNTKDAIAGLFQLGAVDRLLEMYPRISSDPSRAVFDEMRARTGWPEPNASNQVEFLAEREALVAEWRKRLAK